MVVTFSCRSHHLGNVSMPKIVVLEDFSKKTIYYEKILRYQCENKKTLIDL